MGILLEIIGLVVINIGSILCHILENLSMPFVLKMLALIVCNMLGLILIETGYKNVNEKNFQELVKKVLNSE